MKKITILKKEFSLFQLAALIASIIFIIGLIVSMVRFSLQRNAQKTTEEPLLLAVNECVEVCDKIYAKMDLQEDETFIIHKSNVVNSDTAIKKYYATLTLLDYTDRLYISFRDKEAIEYQNSDPNDYNANLYQQELNELQNQFYEKKGNLEKAKSNYSVIKSNE